MTDPTRAPETKLLHDHRDPRLAETDVAPAIHLSTVFERETDGTYPGFYSYTRTANPNRTQLESVLASLEGGAEAACFASGSAAVMAVFQALDPGDHVIVTQDAYHGVTSILGHIMQRWGLASTRVDATDPEAIRAARTPKTRMIWIETPSNPLLRVTDVAKTAELAREAGALLVADNTVSTPILQNPLAQGCDLVVHSTTKYVGGHSDVLGGAVVAKTKGPLMERIRTIQGYGGGVPSPFDCWLALRGARTMAHRVRAQSETALRIASFLMEHPRVAAVHYPGLPTHPGHGVAKRQMKAFGGLLSFQVPGGEAEAFAVVAKAKLMTRATSLGGVETTLEQRASMEYKRTATPPNLIRVSVGLEGADDLIADFAQMLG